MSRKSRQQLISHRHARRFVDDVTGEIGYTNSYKVDHNGRMVKPENYDPVPPQEIIPDIEYPETPELSRPRAPLIYRSYKNVYDFQSSYLDRLHYINTGIGIAELNPDIVVLQLADLQNWEEIDAVWNADYSIFTNSSWNVNINFIDDIYTDLFVFGAKIERQSIRLPGED
jgi:hypothetical protein